MNKQNKDILKSRGKTAKEIKEIESIARRAKSLFDDCKTNGVRVEMASGQRVMLSCGGVLLDMIETV